MNRLMMIPAALLLFVATSASAATVELPPSINIAKQELRINGVGTRQKFYMDLYTAGLYLLQPTQNAKAILESDQLMAMRIVITSKMVSQEKLVASLQEGFKNSTGGKLQPIEKQIQQFRQCFAEEISQRDTFDLVYVPNRGVIVLKNGQQKGTIAGLPFKKALFGVWLGERPADEGLKVALLGSSQRR